MAGKTYLGSIVVAFALGGIGMWAGKPALDHLLAEYHTGHNQPVTQDKPSSTHGMVKQSSNSPARVQSQGSVGANVAQANPFAELRQMQQQMNRFFSQDPFFNSGIFGGNLPPRAGHGVGPAPNGFFGNNTTWFSGQPGSTGTTITQGQDAHSVYYKMKIGNNQDVSNVKVNVKDGYVSINAKLQSKASNSFSASTISEQFPVPAGVNANSAKITRQGDDIVIRFAKV